MRAVGKLQAGWSLSKILSQQFTKQPPRHDKSIPVIREMESIRPRFLLKRKRRLQSLKHFFFAVQRRVPHVDFVPDLFPFL